MSYWKVEATAELVKNLIYNNVFLLQDDENLNLYQLLLTFNIYINIITVINILRTEFLCLFQFFRLITKILVFSSLSFKKKLSNYTLYTASIKMTKMVRSILIYSDLSYFHVNREIWKFSGKFE